MNKWIAEFDLEDGDTMPEHMDLNYMGVQIDFHCRPMWIPCSERLPEKDDTAHVLVTVSIPERPFDIILIPTNSVNQMFKQGHISAWMPLPDPYEGGDENE